MLDLELFAGFADFAVDPDDFEEEIRFDRLEENAEDAEEEIGLSLGFV